MKKIEIFLGCDQPATCPLCGSRTHIIYEVEESEYHQCPASDCGFEFSLEFDDEDLS